MIKYKFNVGDRWEGYIVKHIHFVHSEFHASQESDRFHIERGYAECVSRTGKRSSTSFGIDKRLHKASGQAIMISSQYVGEGF